MQTCSLKVRWPPFSWLPGVILAACSSSHLDAWSQAGGDGGVEDPAVDEDEQHAIASQDAGNSAIRPSDPASSCLGCCMPETQRSDCAADSDCDPSTLTCVQRCGNGQIDADEDCEIGLPGWTRENCSASCRQTVYPNTKRCTFELEAKPTVFYGQGDCADLPGFSEACYYLFGQGCLLVCSTSEDCPIGFSCTPTANSRAFGPGFCVQQVEEGEQD